MMLAISTSCCPFAYAAGEESKSQQTVDQLVDVEQNSSAGGAQSADESQYTLNDKNIQEYAPEVIRSIPQVPCKRAAILDNEGSFVFGKNADEQVKIASITKAMTAIVACDFPMDTFIEVTPYAAGIPGSFAGIMEGDKTTLYEMLKGLMLPSGNDAAYAIAKACGMLLLEKDGRTDTGDETACIERFVTEMNARAAQLGMDDTLFRNPCGLDDEQFEGDHHSSARDVSVMTQIAYEIPIIREIIGKTQDILVCERDGQRYEISLLNTNKLLEANADATGLKTGFTDLAGACVTAMFEDSRGKTYCVVVLGCDTSEECFSAGTQLYDWVRAQEVRENYMVSLPTVFNKGEAAVGYAGHRDWIDKRFAVKVVGYNGEEYERYAWEKSATVRIELDENALSGNILQGKVIGNASVFIEGAGVIGVYDVVAAEEAQEPSWIEKIQIAAIRVVSPLFGQELSYARDEIFCLVQTG